MQRLAALDKQLKNPKSFWTEKSKDDVVICYYKRTALTKAKRGLLKDVHPEQMLSILIKDLLEQTKVPAEKIEDIVIGNVLQSGAGMYKVRLAQFLAGIPDTTPVQSVNRLCASGLEAINQMSNRIQSGQIDIGIAGGVENMSMWDMQEMVRPDELCDEVFDTELARNCLLNMGQTSEKVAERYNIGRQEQDDFALESQLKAKTAQENGWFKDEILPIKVQIKEKGSKQVKEFIVDKDEGIRETTLQGLAKLKPAFGKQGKSTAGNSSQIVDGAAITLLARRSMAKKLNLPILARFAAYTVVGVPPDIMGVGPAYAIPQLLRKTQLTNDDIDVIELNEAFASQSIYCINEAKLDKKKVNPFGGAISLGHPLGCTGARQVATLLNGLKKKKGKLGIVSMCVGTGMGAAALIVNEQQ